MNITQQKEKAYKLQLKRQKETAAGRSMEKFNKITHYDKKIYDHFYQIGLK